MSGMYRSDAHPPRRWMWLPLIVAAGLVVAFLIAGLAYGAAAPASAQYPWAGWWFPGWFFIIPVFFLIFFGLRWFFWGGWGWGWGWYQGNYADSPVETLRQRYARGEITKEQFDQMRRDLEASRA
jgi:putative membrane protein